MNIKGKSIAIALLLGPGLLLLIANQQRLNLYMGRLVIICIALDVVLGILIWLRPSLRHKRLISEGEMAIGRIEEIREPLRGYPDVRYEFETLLGERITKTRQAKRIGLAPGMSVPVFYVPENPKRHVALCTAFYDVTSH